MKYFNEVVQQLVTANDQLISGESGMTIIKAKQIAQNTQVIINAAKVMIDYGKITKTQPEFLKDKKEEPKPDELGHRKNPRGNQAKIWKMLGINTPSSLMPREQQPAQREPQAQEQIRAQQSYSPPSPSQGRWC